VGIGGDAERGEGETQGRREGERERGEIVVTALAVLLLALDYL